MMITTDRMIDMIFFNPASGF